MSDLFSTVRLGALALRNRVVMAPMTRSRAGEGDVPTDHMTLYYRQRASAGLIITEGVQPSPAGKGYWRTPGIHSAEQVEGWRKVADAVHGEGGLIVMQLMHVGRAGARANKAPDAETVAPSAIACAAAIPGPDGSPHPAEVPRALATQEIAGVIGEYVTAAQNARAAGMDAVELHCASGYLPMQFLSSNSNLRTDGYGGSVGGRIRFVVEMLAALADAIGPDRVGFRIAPGVTYNDMADADPAETYAALLEAVSGFGLAYCHLIRIPDVGFDALGLVKRHWQGKLIANCGLTRDTANALIAAGDADAASFGYAFIANPDLVWRFRTGQPLARADRATFYSGNGDDACGYTDYASAG